MARTPTVGVVLSVNGSVLSWAVEGVEDFYVEWFKVFHIAGDYGKPQDACGCGDHGVSGLIRRHALHHTGPFTKDRSVSREDGVISHQAIDPRLQLRGFCRVLFPRALRSCLCFGEDY